MAFDKKGFYREVGLRLAMRRRDRNATQEQVAAAIGIPRATYASIEGGRQRITVDVLWRAAVVLDCPITSLVPEFVQGGSAPKAEPGSDATGSTAAETRLTGADHVDTSVLISAS